MESQVIAPLHIGFTGTRHGMDDRQITMLRGVLLDLQRQHPGVSLRLHHGLCSGADTTAHYLASSMGYYIVGHPCTGPAARLQTPLGCDERRAALPPLDRNRAIVAECSLLIAVPSTSRMLLRSGTWATVRYARDAGLRRYLLLPGERTVHIAG